MDSDGAVGQPVRMQGRVSQGCAAPGPCGGVLFEAGAKGVAFDVGEHGEVMAIGFDGF